MVRAWDLPLAFSDLGRAVIRHLAGDGGVNGSSSRVLAVAAALQGAFGDGLQVAVAVLVLVAAPPGATVASTLMPTDCPCTRVPRWHVSSAP